MAFLLVGCLGSLLAAFWHGSSLLSQETPRQKFPSLPKHNRPKLPSDERLGNLQCAAYGGPSDDVARDMVYWQNIPSDHAYKSPFFPEDGVERYLTFEPDGGGFNNIRMAMEVVLTLAHAMGRTLVLPPDQNMYLLYKQDNHQKREFGFQDFFPMEDISNSQAGLKIITTKEFLQRIGVTGKLRDLETGEISFPPMNWTVWDMDTNRVERQLNPWLRKVGYVPLNWNPDECLVAFPASPGSLDALEETWENLLHTKDGLPDHRQFIGHPTPVYGSSILRLQENHRRRKHLCLYNRTMQEQVVIHFPGKRKFGGRLLTQFYMYVFFENWKQYVWTARFIRDQVRYRDEIQCAGARVVEAVRQRARHRDPVNNPYGDFDAFHVRRGDFQYRSTRISAMEMYNVSRDEIPEGATVYIGTDERDKSFFANMSAHFDVVFLDDFAHLLKGVNTNFYGLIDQLITSQSRTFFGCWYSTFSGYINRLRGYHTDRLKLPGFERGITNSFYYAPLENKYRMREYWPISGSDYAREFPISWRNIDQGIGQMDEEL